ncbi:MAG: hypothetical protein MMC33_000710 [Icmadophila ericetorum]|nr:hypothetical protein [Icmadophila ericetorum]
MEKSVALESVGNDHLNLSKVTTPQTSVQGNKDQELPSHGEEKAMKEPDLEQEQVYPEGLKLAIIVTALCLSVFLVALDATIIATAIPKITTQFNSLNDVGWYASAYLFLTCSLQLMFGKFYSIYNIKILFILAILIFEIGSLVCATAPSSPALIVGRAIAGLGAAGIFSGALTIIAHSLPIGKRPICTSLVAAMYGPASIAGPLLGGVFTDHVTWRWCFYINLPIGALVAASILLFLTSPPQQQPSQPLSYLQIFLSIDPVSLITLLPSVISLLLALQLGGSTFPYSNPRIIVLFLLFGIFGLFFIMNQFRLGPLGTLPPYILRNKNILGAALYSFCFGASYYTILYFLPIYFQAIKGVSALQSGIDTFAMLVGNSIMTLLSGYLVSKYGYYTPFMYAAVVMMAIGAGLFTTLNAASGTAEWVVYQLLYGFGAGLGFQQPYVVAQTILPLNDIAIGCATMLFVSLLGGTITVSVANAVFKTKLVNNLLRIVPHIDPQTVVAVGATGLKKIAAQGSEDYAGVVFSYNNALMKTFQIALIMICIGGLGAVFVEWNSVKSGKGKGKREKKKEEVDFNPA